MRPAARACSSCSLGLGFCLVYLIGMRPTRGVAAVPGHDPDRPGRGPVRGRLARAAGRVQLDRRLLAGGAGAAGRVALVPRSIAVAAAAARLRHSAAWRCWRMASWPPRPRSPRAEAWRAAGFGSSPFADTVTLDAPIAAGQTFSVNNSSGRTTIRTGSGPDVHVVATKHYSLGGQAPDVRLTPGGSGVSLDASNTNDRFPFGGSSSVDYVIEVPATVAGQGAIGQRPGRNRRRQRRRSGRDRVGFA